MHFISIWITWPTTLDLASIQIISHLKKLCRASVWAFVTGFLAYFSDRVIMSLRWGKEKFCIRYNWWKPNKKWSGSVASIKTASWKAITYSPTERYAVLIVSATVKIFPFRFHLRNQLIWVCASKGQTDRDQEYYVGYTLIWNWSTGDFASMVVLMIFPEP